MQSTHDVHRTRYRTVTATSAGAVAVETLATASQAAILGITSRGIFIRLDTRRVIFCTTEHHHSPLTITLPETTTEVETVTPEHSVQVRADYVTFPDAGLEIHIPAGITWACPAPTEPALPAAVRRQHLRRLVSSIAVTTPDRGWSRLLPALLDLDHAQKIPPPLHATWKAIKQCRSALAAGDVASITQIATRLLGRGRGLTPSGDDFTLGFTLMLNRWPAVAEIDRTRLAAYNRCVVNAAYAHTTALSATLIESASTGISDERLIRTADYLATGTPSLASTVMDVLHWGSSSGIDALVGMAVAVTSTDRVCT